jgi:release factor glutamine methyltransferase
MEKSWKIIDLLKTVSQFLQDKGIENPRLNAELLLGKVLNLNRVHLYLQFERPLTSSELEAYREFVRRRAKHEPLQYILGETEFMGLPFRVNSHVLIPRPETELLVEETLKLQNAFNSSRVEIVEIGSGSGCIAVSLAKHWPATQVYATDISDEALEVAGENARLNAVQERVTLVRHDFFSEWDASLPKQMDIFISNPPYIRQDEIKSLPSEVKEFEPLVALTDGADGLRFYRRVFELIASRAIQPHFVLLELSGTQAEKIVDLSKQYDLKNQEVIPDLNQINRILKIKVSE